MPWVKTLVKIKPCFFFINHDQPMYFTHVQPISQWSCHHLPPYKKKRDASLATRGDKAYPARWSRKHRGTVAIRTPLTVEVLYGFIVEILT
jgi:hypothetical protein